MILLFPLNLDELPGVKEFLAANQFWVQDTIEKHNFLEEIALAGVAQWLTAGL